MFVLAPMLLGLIIGSFLNVVILRYRVKGLGGRSGCRSCRHELAWHDLIPVLSWIALRGTCRYCGSRVSVQYPLVELSTGVLFALLANSPFPVGGVYTAAFCAIAALLVCICVYDLRHTIIPDTWVWSFNILAFITMPPLYAVLAPRDVPIWPFFLAGFVVAAPLFFLWFVSSGRWMGFGDVKFALGMGWLLGPMAGLFALWLSFAMGAVVMLSIVGWQRVSHRYRLGHWGAGLTMKSEVPFGPFLVIGLLIVWISQLYGYDVTALALGVV